MCINSPYQLTPNLLEALAKPGFRQISKNHYIYIKFYMKSWVSSAGAGNMSMFNQHSSSNILSIKNSYMLLSWINLVFGSKIKITVRILPNKKRLFWITRSPMAAKTNSIEHYEVKMSTLMYSVKVPKIYFNHIQTLDSRKKALLGITCFTKKLKPLNSFFLNNKSTIFPFFFKDSCYFKYN